MESTPGTWFVMIYEIGKNNETQGKCQGGNRENTVA